VFVCAQRTTAIGGLRGPDHDRLDSVIDLCLNTTVMNDVIIKEQIVKVVFFRILKDKQICSSFVYGKLTNHNPVPLTTLFTKES
jgi:hypothetical protein